LKTDRNNRFGTGAEWELEELATAYQLLREAYDASRCRDKPTPDPNVDLKKRVQTFKDLAQQAKDKKAKSAKPADHSKP
jgi:hypothetical protein